MARMRAIQTFRAAAAVFIAGVVIAACGSCGSRGELLSAKYCAIMPDSVGLYEGNEVTQMGYPVGKVTSIDPSMRNVRVEFSMAEKRPLPANVRAVIRSTSILADRSLELVGNYESGPKLTADECIPLDQSFTPKSLSEVVGASTDFLNSINPSGSDNVGDIVNLVDQAIQGQGPGINSLWTRSSALLDSPDEPIGDIGTIIKNLAVLTSTVSEIRGTLKQVLYDANASLPDAATAVWGGDKIFAGLVPLVDMISDLESQLGGEIQQTLDVVSVAVRKLSPRAPFYAKLLNPVPRWINGTANVLNNHQFSIRYRPPLYRVRTPDGVATCNIMNASMPGSCANVQGTPYAVDVALLQYVLTQAANR